MEQEFNIKKGWKIFGYTFCVIIIMITLYFLVDAILSDKNVLLWIGLNLVFNLFFGYLIVAIYRGKVVLTSDSIIEYTVFGKKKLLFSEIKGFRIQAAKIILEPCNKSKSRLIIGDFSYTINGPDLAEFLTNKFKNLDESAYETELSDALNNPAIGDNTSNREQRIKNARKVARALNIGGFIIFFWLYVFPQPYHLAVISGLLYPLIVMAYFLTQQPIVALLDTGKDSVYPNLTSALIVPIGGVGLRVILQYPLLNIADCIMPVALLAVVLALVFVWLLRPSKARVSNLWVGLFFCLVYSASGIGMLNCAFDYSRPVEYRAKVLDRWILHNPTSYNVKLDAWAQRKKQEVESVSRTTYDQVKKGEWVTVYVKKGYLNITWYFVE